MSQQRLRPEERLHRSSEYRRIRVEGRTARGKHLLFAAAPNSLGRMRFGIAFSRPAPKAVRRNRIKRILREIYRRNKHLFRGSLDVVFVARSEVGEIPHAQTLAEISAILKRHPCFH